MTTTTTDGPPVEAGARIAVLLADSAAAQFWVCLSGPEPDAEPAAVAELLVAHLEYIANLEQQGVLFAAGPFLDEDGRPGDRALFVLRAPTEASAHALADAEPLHRAGLRGYTLHRWQLNQGRISLSMDFSRQSAGLDGPPPTPAARSSL